MTGTWEVVLRVGRRTREAPSTSKGRADILRSCSNTSSRREARPSLSAIIPHPRLLSEDPPSAGNEPAHQFSVVTTTRDASTTQYFSWWNRYGLWLSPLTFGTVSHTSTPSWAKVARRESLHARSSASDPTGEDSNSRRQRTPQRARSATAATRSKLVMS